MLVNIADMRKFMGGMSFTEMQQQVVEHIVSGVQSDLEAYLNRPVEPVLVRETVDVNDQGILYLSVTPVHRVLAIRYAPTGGVSGYYYPDPADRVDPTSLVVAQPTDITDRLVHMPGGIKVGGGLGQRYEVEYVGGLCPSNQQRSGFKRAIEVVAARDIGSLHVTTEGTRTGQVDQTEVGDARFLGWSDDELKRFQRYRRRIAIR